MQEDLEVTGISRSGRVRKKSSKLMDFESPDDIETRFRRQTPVKTYTGGFRQEENQEFPQESTPQRQAEDAGTASGSESDYYENPGENADSMESDSSASDEGSTRTPANSLYMMEKSTKKKLIVKDGRVVGRAKAQRKDKGKTRITAYMMWAKEARNELLRKHPDMDFSAISKRLGEMWSNVNYNERYLWKRKAKRFAMQKEQSNQTANKIISNPKNIPTKDQLSVLVEFMSDHKSLANGRLAASGQTGLAKALWVEIVDILNSMDGCQKTVSQWRKVWANKKIIKRNTMTVNNNAPSVTSASVAATQSVGPSATPAAPKVLTLKKVPPPPLFTAAATETSTNVPQPGPAPPPAPPRREVVCTITLPPLAPLRSAHPARPLSTAGPGRPPAVRAAPKPQPAPPTPPQQAVVPVSSSPASGAGAGGMYRVTGCGAVEVAAHLRLLGESLAIIGERLKEHEGQIAVSGSVSVLLDTLLCSLAPLLSVCRAIPAIAPPQRLLQDTLHNIAYIMPGL